MAMAMAMALQLQNKLMLRRYTFLALIPGQPYLQKRAVTEREAIARMSCVDRHIVIVIVIVNHQIIVIRELNI